MVRFFKHKQSRREFFRSIMRYSILGGMVFTTGTLITKRKSASAEGKSAGISVCRTCTFLNKCDQPSALLARGEMAD